MSACVIVRRAGDDLEGCLDSLQSEVDEIVVVDGAFGVRLTDVVSPAERIRNIN